MMGLITFEVETPRCTVLVVVRDGVVEQSPPALFYLQGWSYERLVQHCKRENWTLATLSIEPSNVLVPEALRRDGGEW